MAERSLLILLILSLICLLLVSLSVGLPSLGTNSWLTKAGHAFVDCALELLKDKRLVITVLL